MPAIFPVMLTYRECFPYDFKGPKISDLEMLVGDDGPKIDFFMNQEPCTWNQTYEIIIIGPDGKTEILPAYIDQDGTILIINPPENTDIGNYDIQICSQIDNSLSTRECTDFEIVIEPVGGANITVTFKPDWLVNLQNQRVKVGDNLVYSPGI